jgi:hypothetical protein
MARAGIRQGEIRIQARMHAGDSRPIGTVLYPAMRLPLRPCRDHACSTCTQKKGTTEHHLPMHLVCQGKPAQVERNAVSRFQPVCGCK